jgi:isopentenyl-diphosphate delta-isomerase
MTIAREAHIVDLVDQSGASVGQATVGAAHTAPGRLHRAFSVFLRDPAGDRVLLQQRAAVKTRFPLRWANTCCGHPLPGEDVEVAARRRLAEELGVAGIAFTPVGVHTYRAEDPVTGRVEYEYDHVLLGDLPPGVQPAPDPAEVADTRWVTLSALLAGFSADPEPYAPWLFGVTACLVDYLAQPHPSRSNAGGFEAPERSGGR